MPQIDISGSDSKLSCDKLQGQSGTTVNVLTGHTLAIADSAGLTLAGVAVNAGSLGKVVQVVNVMDGAVATSTNRLNSDDTIPQITEGNEIMTLAITPTNSSNMLLIDVIAFGASDNTGAFQLALFVGTTANALAVVSNINAGGATGQAVIRHKMTAGVTSALTFRARMGQPTSSAGTLTFNGLSSARKYGGVAASSITITEISV
jgi:hypothetical protein